MIVSEGAGVSIVSRECSLLLCCGKKDIDPATFAAINSNSLVYDGRLVVDNNFCTNDPSVYGGGPLVKFARRFRVKLAMELVSPREAGVKLAQALLPILDPLSPAPLAGGAGEVLPAPTFSLPRMESATLPGSRRCP